MMIEDYGYIFKVNWYYTSEYITKFYSLAEIKDILDATFFNESFNLYFIYNGKYLSQVAFYVSFQYLLIEGIRQYDLPKKSSPKIELIEDWVDECIAYAN